MSKKAVDDKEVIELEGEIVLKSKHNKTVQGAGVTTLKVLHYKQREKSVVKITYYDDDTKTVNIKAPDKGTEKILFEYFSWKYS